MERGEAHGHHRPQVQTPKSLNSKSTLHKDPWDDDLEEVVRAFGGARAFLVVMGGET